LRPTQAVSKIQLKSKKQKKRDLGMAQVVGNHKALGSIPSKVKNKQQQQKTPRMVFGCGLSPRDSCVGTLVLINGGGVPNVLWE
jgi:hypothetical protein